MPMQVMHVITITLWQMVVNILPITLSKVCQSRGVSVQGAIYLGGGKWLMAASGENFTGH